MTKIYLLILIYILIFLIFIIPLLINLYVIPKNYFTCSGGNKYLWCDKFSPVNITIIGNENNYVIGKFIYLKQQYNCKMHDYKEISNVGYSFDGYYRNLNECFSSKHYNKYIINKNNYNRRQNLLALYVLFLICTTFILGVPTTILIEKYEDMEKNEIKYEKVYTSEFLNLKKQIEMNSFVKIQNLNDLCIYCQEKLSNEDEIIGLPCAHYFHENCINVNEINKINLKNHTFICPVCIQHIFVLTFEF